MRDGKRGQIEIKRKGEVWNLINRERKKKIKTKGGHKDERIGMEKWKEHFIKVLGGIEKKIVDGWGKEN